MEWNEANSELIQRLYRDGKTAREIAAIVGGGVTRNAIIGKLNRIKRQSGGASSPARTARPGATRTASSATRTASSATRTGATRTAGTARPASSSASAASRKAAAKPAAKKVAKPSAKKVAAKKVAKPVAKKTAAKPSGKKTAAKPVAKPASATRTGATRTAGRAASAAGSSASAASRKVAGSNGKAPEVVPGSAVVAAPLPASLLLAEKSADGDALFGGGGCKWPIGHPGEADFHFCGEPAFEELPYCEAHALQAYQPADKRRSMRM